MTTPDQKQPVLIKFSDIKPEKLEWLWPERIPLGMPSMIVGDQDKGKSLLTLYMAAQVSAGGYWPDIPEEKVEVGSVVILTAEDDLSRTVRPRLEAAGANLKRVVTITAIKESGQNNEDKERNLYNLTTDLVVLREATRQISDVRLIIIDPISAYMGGTNQNSNGEVREFMAPLAKLATESGAAIVGISHLNKDFMKPAAYRTLGSIGFTAAARAVWLVAENPEDKNQRLFTVIKNNLSPERTGLAFGFEGVQVKTEKGLITQPKCRFEPGVVDKTADEILFADYKKNRGPTRLEEAMEWLEDMLSDGPKLVEDIYKTKPNRISESTLGKAKRKLGVESIEIRKDGKICGWKWSLTTKESKVAKDS